jgi:hypothetical protein
MNALPPGFTLRARSAFPSDDEVGAYITEAARQRGIPEQDALDVWAGEGKGAWQSNFHKNGKRERSYGPYQLYVDGGLGNKFQNETGLDPSDPSTWKQGVDYALDTAKKEGWRQWYGAPANLRARGGYDEPMMLGPASGLPEGFKVRPRNAAPTSPSPATTDVEMPKAPPQHTPWGEIGDDASRSYISSMIDAGTALAGLPGEAIKGAQWLDRKLGINSEGSDTPVNFDVEGVRKATEGKIGDWSYTPQTGAGELASKVPYAIGGPAKNIPGIVAGATIGEDIGGTTGEVIGAVAGGLPGARSKIMKVNARGEADKAYKAIEQANIAIKGDDFHNFGKQLANDSVIKKALLNPTLYPKVKGVVDEIASHVPGPPKVNPMAVKGFAGQGAQPQWNPGGVSFEDFDNIRQNAVRVLMRSNDPGERRIANHLISRMDGYFDNAQLSAGSGMTAKEAASKAKEARTFWKQHRKSQEIETILEVAKDDAGRFSISGHENAIRTGFRQLSKRVTRYPSVAAKYTDEEKALIHKLSRGGTVRNMMQWVSKLTPNAITAPIGLGYGAHTGDWESAALIGGVGLAGRAIGGMSAKRQADKLRKLTASGGKRTKPKRAQPFISGYLASQDQE